LETVVLKAMAKAPAERYATAQELADDLRRFLEDKPIRARRPSWTQRLRKWALRHRAAVTTGVVAAVVLLAGAVAALTVSNARITQERNQKEAALRQSRADEEAATRRLKQALQAVDRLLTRAADEDRLLDVNHREVARKALYEDALEFYERLLPESNSDPQLRLETALAYGRMGRIRANLSQFTEAEEGFRRGIALAKDLMTESPHEPGYRRALAGMLWEYSDFLRKIGGRSQEGEQGTRAGLELWLCLADEFPADSSNRMYVGLCQRQLALWLGDAGRVAEAEQFVRRALATHQELTEGAVPGRDIRENLVQDWHDLAGILHRQKRDPEAESAYRHALKEAQKLKAAYPRGATTRNLLALVQRDLGSLLGALGQRDEARELLAQAVAGCREVANDFPDIPYYIEELAVAEIEQGRFLVADGMRAERENDFAEAESAFRQALDDYEKAAGSAPDAQQKCQFKAGVAHCWDRMAQLWLRQGRFQQAEEARRHGLALYQQLFEESPQDSEARRNLANCHNNLAWLLVIRPDRQPQHTAEALEHAQKAVDLEPGYHDWWHTLGVAHCRLGHGKEALAAIEKSRQLSGQPGPDSWDRFFEAMAYSGLGDKERARRCYDEGVQWMAQHAPDHPDLRRFRAEAAQMLGISSGP
jgi:tetratricopeptide (TPR) repeat protein